MSATPTVKDIKQLTNQQDSILAVKENTSAAEAARKMSRHHVGSLFVFDIGGNFAGLLTERDMLEKVLTKSLAPDNLPVRDIMTTDIITVTGDTKIEELEQIMAEHKIRHIPIFEQGIPVGRVSSRDIIAYHLRTNRQMKAAAEQLAMLPTGLKSLDFDDVVELAINEVPKSFNAERAVLCLVQKGAKNPIIYRNGCSLPQEKLFSPDEMKLLPQNARVISDQMCSDNCDNCTASDTQASRLIIPLEIYNRHDGADDAAINMNGFLCMCCPTPSDSDSHQLRLYKASLLRALLNANLTNAKLYHYYQKARHDSEIDPLTDVGTRRLLEKALKTECIRAIRYNHPFSLAIIDLDNFKQINDSAGHAAGDKALKQLAMIIRHKIRKTDVVARYGGDEFVLLMPETRINEAVILLERLRQHTRSISLGQNQAVTISCGLADWNGSTTDTPEEILRRADSALYEAKRRGRNCIVPSQPTPSKV